MAVYPQIFVSYSHQNENARLFIGLLTAHINYCNERAKQTGNPQFVVWSDNNLKSGDHWSNKIDEALDNSFAVIIAVTPESMQSHYVTYEWAYAIGRKSFVLPILISEVDENSFHNKIREIQWNEFWKAKEYSHAIEKLFEILEDKYLELVRLDRIEVSKEIAQRIRSNLDLGRSQRTGDLNNAMDSLASAQKEINDFNNRFPLLADGDLTEVDKLADDVYYEIGFIYYMRKNYEDARKYFDLALEKNKTHIHSIIGLGVLHRIQADKADIAQDNLLKEQHLEKAYVCFEDALKLQLDVKDENDESVWASLGGICKRLGKRHEAVEHYIKAARFKKSAYPYGNLGLLYIEMNEPEKMVTNFRVALYFAKAKLRLHPEDKWAHNDELVAQLILNQCSDNESEKIENEKLRQIIDRVLIIVEGYPLNRLQSVIKYDLLPQYPPVVNKELATELLERIDRLLK